jgi:hypothetical protein
VFRLNHEAFKTNETTNEKKGTLYSTHVDRAIYKRSLDGALLPIQMVGGQYNSEEPQYFPATVARFWNLKEEKHLKIPQ